MNKIEIYIDWGRRYPPGLFYLPGEKTATMIEGAEGDDNVVLNRLDTIPETERESQGVLVSRHIDFLSELLAAEQIVRDWKRPVGCVDAIDNPINHRRGAGGYYPCVYERVETFERKIGDGLEDRTTATVSTNGSQTAACHCDDPLANSEETLDSILAVVLAPEDRPPRERYFERHWREVVTKLRGHYGSWEAIAAHPVETLHDRTRSFAINHHGGVARRRLEQLLDALEYFREHRYFDELAFETVSRASYDQMNQMLAGAPGISESDAWWLQLVALDQRIWPSDPVIDALLAQLGLLDPDAVGERGTNRRAIAEEITPRQLLDLHRGLAVHSHYSGATPCGSDCAIQKFLLTYRQNAQTNRDQTTPTVVDLFAGAGGFSQGFRQAGYEVSAAIDKNQQATDTYRLNHPEIPHSRVITSDIADLDSSTVDREAPGQHDKQTELSSPSRIFDEINGDIDVVVGGPPCQAFSKAGYRASGNEDYTILDDPRADLYTYYVDLIDTLEPAAIVMENVKGILASVNEDHPGNSDLDGDDTSDTRIIDLVMADLEEIGYDCTYQTVDCSEHGIPQTRERILITGLDQKQVPADIRATDIRDGLANRTASTDDEVTIHDALTKLPRLRRGEGAAVSITNRDVVGRPTKYASKLDLPGGISVVTSHRSRQHPREKDREMFETVMEPGDTGWDVKYRHGRPDLLDYPVGSEENPKFDDKYRMLGWFNPAPTIMAHLQKDSNDFVLPDFYEYVQSNQKRMDQRRNRGLTPREAARLQTFPDDYIFLGSFISHFVQIGNAVPPVLSKKVAQTISEVVLDRAGDAADGRTGQKKATANAGDD